MNSALFNKKIISDKLGNKNPDIQNYIKSVIESQQDAFSKSEYDFGYYKYKEIKLHLSNRSRLRKLNSRIGDEDTKRIYRREIQELCKAGVIQKVTNPLCSSPIVELWKKDGCIRLCINYKISNVNENIDRDPFPPPKPEEIAFKRAGFRYYSHVDLIQTNYQFPIARKIREFTAFEFEGEYFQFLVMPFGICFGSDVIQSELTNLLVDKINEGVDCYYDDILIYSNSLEEHYRLLNFVLQRLIEGGLKAKLTKCKFFEEEVEYLGYLVGTKGLMPGPKCIDKVFNSFPNTFKERKVLYNKLSILNKFIPNFMYYLVRLNQGRISNNRSKWVKKIKSLAGLIEPLKCLTGKGAVELMIYTSSVSIGAGLFEIINDSQMNKIEYFSLALKRDQLNMPKLEIECFAICQALRHFKEKISARRVIICTTNAEHFDKFLRESISSEYCNQNAISCWLPKGITLVWII